MVFTIIILGIIAFALFGYIVKQEIEEEKAKIKTIKTKILFKRYERVVSDGGSRIENVLRFDINGDNIPFDVSKKVYNKHNVGEKGILTYKGEDFIKFEVQNEE